jgi:hypothetical protein
MIAPDLLDTTGLAGVPEGQVGVAALGIPAGTAASISCAT